MDRSPISKPLSLKALNIVFGRRLALALISGILCNPLSLMAAQETTREVNEVYRDVDENGVPSFSDQNTPGAEKIEVKEPMTFDSKVFVPEGYEIKPKPGKTATINYRAEITSPANGAAIRENSGALTLNVTISPYLAPGHKAQIMMDGTPLREITGGGPVALTNVDRGTHAFTVQITNNRGAVLKSSPAVSVTLLRHSVN